MELKKLEWEDVKHIIKPKNSELTAFDILSAVFVEAKRKLCKERASRSNAVITIPLLTNGTTDGVTKHVVNKDQPERASKKRKIQDYSIEEKEERKKICKRSDMEGKKIEASKTRGSSDVPKFKKSEVSNGPFPPPPLPEAFMNAILKYSEGRNLSQEIKLVIQKGLFASDVNPNLNRLSMMMSDIVSLDFLNKEEATYIGSRNWKGKPTPVEVRVIDPDYQLRTLKFNKWEMPKKGGKAKSSLMYLLHGEQYMEMVRGCNLQPKMVLQVWAFRVDGELGFALVRLPLEGN